MIAPGEIVSGQHRSTVLYRTYNVPCDCWTSDEFIVDGSGVFVLLNVFHPPASRCASDCVGYVLTSHHLGWCTTDISIVQLKSGPV